MGKKAKSKEITFSELQEYDLSTAEELHALFPHWKRTSILKKLSVCRCRGNREMRFVARTNGKIIAHLKITFGKGLHKHRAEMTSLVVLPAQRHKHIALNLTKFVLKNLPEKITLVTLAVDKKNATAIHIYKKLGFKKYGYLKKASVVNGKYVDNYLMEKNV